MFPAHAISADNKLGNCAVVGSTYSPFLISVSITSLIFIIPIVCLRVREGDYIKDRYNKFALIEIYFTMILPVLYGVVICQIFLSSRAHSVCLYEYTIEIIQEPDMK